MNVDTDSLEKLNLLTRDAAERASNILTETAETSTHIGTTKIMLADHQDVVAELLAGSDVCVQVTMTGPLSGTVLLTFDTAAVEQLAEAFQMNPTDESFRDEQMTDIAETMLDGFVTDWETYLGDELAVRSPISIDDPDAYEFELDATGPETDSAPLFYSKIQWLHEPASTGLYLIPDRDSLERLLTTDENPTPDTSTSSTSPDSSDSPSTADTTDSSGPFGLATDSEDTDNSGPFGSGDDGSEDTGPFGANDESEETGPVGADEIDTDTGSFGMAADDDGDDSGPFDKDDDADGDSFGMDDDSLFGDTEEVESLSLEKLTVFSDLTKEGTTAAADRVTQMTGIETQTEIAGVSFTPIDDISGQLEEGSFVGTTVEFEGTPSGYLIILFRETSAVNIAEAMMPMEADDNGLTDMHRSAIEELCNIMTSGFIDGWANVLQTSVEHTPPEFVDDMDMALIKIVTDQLGPFQTHAYTIESRMKTDEIEFDCEIHALPNEAELGKALDTLLLERRDQTEADPSDLF